MNEADISRLAGEFAELGLDREVSFELARTVQCEIDAALEPVKRQIISLEELLAQYQMRALLRKF